MISTTFVQKLLFGFSILFVVSAQAMFPPWCTVAELKTENHAGENCNHPKHAKANVLVAPHDAGQAKA